MRVLVDAMIVKPGLGGIRTYVTELVGALARQPGLEIGVITSEPEAFAGAPVEIIEAPEATRSFLVRLAYREVRLPEIVRSWRAQWLVSGAPELPLVRKPGVPSVVMVYDLGPLLMPQYSSAAKRARFRWLLPRTCRDATFVACISEATVVGLRSAAPVVADKCFVLHGGAPVNAVGSEPVRVPPRFVLYVGTMLPHKNVSTLVEAFRNWPGAVGVPLVIVGPRGNSDQPSAEVLAAAEAEQVVVPLGWVSAGQVRWLYEHAEAVAMPTLFEGFGLPVLEALAAGTLAVVSDIAVLREVAGDAAVYVSDPLDPAAWQVALSDLLADDRRRVDLAEAGRERAMRFSWDDSAAVLARTMRQR